MCQCVQNTSFIPPQYCQINSLAKETLVYSVPDVYLHEGNKLWDFPNISFFKDLSFINHYREIFLIVVTSCATIYYRYNEHRILIINFIVLSIFYQKKKPLIFLKNIPEFLVPIKFKPNLEIRISDFGCSTEELPIAIWHQDASLLIPYQWSLWSSRCATAGDLHERKSLEVVIERGNFTTDGLKNTETPPVLSWLSTRNLFGSKAWAVVAWG